MRVVVTRPAAQAASWTQALAAQGIDAVALPLIRIAAAADGAAVEQAWHAIATQRLVVFVSPNAAEQFFLHRPAGLAWPERTLAGSVGPGTSEALRHAGVPASSIVEPAADAAQFDSEALWEQLSARDWQGASVLIVRGDGGREWLADMLRSAGASVHFVAAYARASPHFDAEAARLLDQAIAQPARHVWFFSSSEALAHLCDARPAASWAQARAIATHPRIAQRARECGFGVIHETRATLQAVVACIQSIAS